MATQKTKLIQDQRGSPELEVLDLGQVDDMFSLGEKYKTQGVKRDFVAGLKKGVIGDDGNKGKIRAKAILTNFLRSMAPDSINRAYGLLDETRGLLTDVVKEVERKRPNDLSVIAKEARDMLPHLKGKVSDALYSRLDAGVVNKIEHYRYQQEENRSSNVLYQRMKAQRERNQKDRADLKEALDQGTLVNERLHEISEQRQDRRFQIEQTERGLRDQVSQKRYDFLSRAMSIAADGVTRMTNYQEQVGYNLARKSIELQFRTYTGIRDMLEIAKTQLELHDRGYTALVKNTGTPDHLKSSMKELVNFNMANRASENITQKLVRGIPAFLGSYGDQIRANIVQKMGTGAQLLSAFLTSGSVLPEDAWEQRYKLAGEFGGGAAADWIKNRLAPRMGRKFKPFVEKYFDKYTSGGHNHLAYLLDNAPQLAQAWVNDPRNSVGTKGYIQTMLKGILPQYRMDDTLKDQTYHTIDKGAEFNQMTQRTIIDIIPGLLARQLRELTNIRRGTDDTPLIRFDITTGKFAEDGVALANLSHAVIGRGTKRNVSSTIDNAIDTMDKAGNLSPEARKALAATLLRDAATNKAFDPGRYAGSRFKDAPSDEVNKELNKFFANQFEFNAKGNMSFNADNNRKLNEFSKAFVMIRNVAKDPFEEIERIVKSGNSEALRVLGIIYTDRGEDRINYERLWEIMRGDVRGHNPYAGEHRMFGGQTDPFADDFMGPRKPRGGAGGFFDEMNSRARSKFEEMRSHFSGPADSPTVEEVVQRTVDEMRRQSQAAADVARESATEATNAASDFMKDAGAHASDAFKAASEKMGGFRKAKPAEEVKDLHVAGTDLVVVRAVDIRNGDLIDVNTGRVITGVSDITGPVINRQGDEIVSEVEATIGLADGLGVMVFKKQTGLMGDYIPGPAKERGLSVVGERIGETFDQDWYIEGREEPLLLGRDIRGGQLIDANTSKVIRAAEDITGRIINQEGDTVATEEELKQRLFNPYTGAVLKLAKLFRIAFDIFFGKGTLGQRLWNLTKSVAGKTGLMAWGAVKKVTDNFIGNQDAYVPDTDTPIVTGNALRRGEYFDKDGKVITSFRDHYGPVYNAQGQVIVTDEQRKDLLNVDGTQHDLSKKWKFGRAFANTYMRMTKAYYRWLGRKAGNAGKWVGGKVAGIADSLIEHGKLETPTDQLLGGILQVLKERLNPPKKELRKGSWEEKYAKAAERDKDGDGKDDAEAAEERKTGSITKGIMALAAQLKGKDRDKDDDEDDEEESGKGLSVIEDVIMGGGGDDEDTKSGKKKKGKGKKKVSRAAPKKGLIGRALGGLWGAVSGAGRTAFGAAASAAGFFTMAALGTAGTALMAVLTSPITLGIAAVAATGYAAYRLHGWWKTKGELRDYRLMQYGADSLSERKKVVNLEAFLEPKLDKTNGYALKLQKDDLKTMCDIMDLKMENQFNMSGIGFANKAGIFGFSRWLDLRFRPVFTKAIQAMDAVKLQGSSLGEIDNKIPDELKYTYIEAAKLPFDGSDSPYQYTVAPWGDPEAQLTVSLEQIRSRYEELVQKYQKISKGVDPEELKTQKHTAAAAMAKKGAELGKKALNPTKVPSGDGSLLKVQPKPNGPVGITPINPTAPVNPQASVVPTHMSKAMAASLTASLGKSSAVSVLGPKANLTRLTSLQAVRFRAYGLETTTIADCEALLSLEEHYFLNAKVDQDGNVTYQGNLGELIDKMGILFGVPTEFGPRRDKLFHWFLGRFEPVFKTYLGVVRRELGTIQLGRVESQLKPPSRFQVANAIMGSTNQDGNLWEVESIFDVVGMLDGLKIIAESEVKVLQQEADKYILETPAMTPSQQAAAKTQAESGKGFATAVVDAVKSAANAVSDTAKSTWQKVSDGVTSTGAAIASRMSGNAGTMDTRGSTFSGVTPGNGGAWTEIPMPTKNEDRAAAMPTINKAAEMVGVPAALMAIFISLESGFNARAWAGKNSPGQTASGWFQFIDKTWDGMMAKHWKKYGLPDPAGDPKREMRFDPRINALMGAEFMKEVYTTMKKLLGRDPSDTDIYMGHFLGPVTAVKFLKADPNIIGERLFPEQARANPGIFRVKGGGPRTLGQIYALMDAKIAPHRGNGDTSMTKAAAGKEETKTSAVEKEVEANGAGDEASEQAKATDTNPGMTATPVASTAASASPGPSPTGSTPVNTGMGPTPVGVLKLPDPAAADTTGTSTTPTSTPATNQYPPTNPNVKAAEAQDRLAQKRAEQTVATNQEMADIAKEQLAVLRRIEQLLAAGKGNDMPNSSQPSGRPASSLSPPVPLR